MGKVVVATAWIALVAAVVWYAVTKLPRTEDSAAQVELAPAAPEAGEIVLLPTPRSQVGCGTHCGTERWAVKTMSDADRGLVDMRPIAASVESLAALPREAGGANSRGGDPERRVFRVRGFLGGTKDEKDGDVHLIVFGMTNQRVSLIAEIPDPRCAGACRSGLSAKYAQARESLAACLAKPNRDDRPIVVDVEGVGFFDRNHGQVGRAPNVFELHPVLRVSCSK